MEKKERRQRENSLQGASEQYMWSFTSSLTRKGLVCPSFLSSFLWRIASEPSWLLSTMFWHSSSRKRLRARMANTSACQSWIATPFAPASFDAGRHFMPVLRFHFFFREEQRTKQRIKHLAYASAKQVKFPFLSATMPLRGTHSWRPLSRTQGFRLDGSFSNWPTTARAMRFARDVIYFDFCCPWRIIWQLHKTIFFWN